MEATNVKSVIAEVVSLLEPLSDNDKRQAFALLQGMIIGKELSDQQTKTA